MSVNNHTYSIDIVKGMGLVWVVHVWVTSLSVTIPIPLTMSLVWVVQIWIYFTLHSVWNVTGLGMTKMSVSFHTLSIDIVNVMGMETDQHWFPTQTSPIPYKMQFQTFVGKIPL